MLLVGSICAVILLNTPSFRIWEFMRPYRTLVEMGATEHQVRVRYGTPDLVIYSDAELTGWMRGMKP